MRRAQMLRNGIYQTLMVLLIICRSAITWIYCILMALSLITLGHLSREGFREFHASDLLSISTFAIMAFTFGAAWWKTFRHSPHEKGWVIAASIANVLFIFIFAIKSPAILLHLGAYWIFVVISIVGTLVYVIPNRWAVPRQNAIQ